MTIVLGVDGGGTKTLALALDEHGNIIGKGVGGGSNYQTIGMDTAINVFADVIKQALRDHQADFSAWCLAGCDSALDEARLHEGLTGIGLAQPFRLYNDAFAVLRAGSRFPYGAAVICGTGFNACGISPTGKQHKLHSLGPLTGDWGGGYNLGEAAIGSLFRADEGRGEPTALQDVVLKALDVPDLEVLAEQITIEKVPYRQISALAPVVFDVANAGDKVAQGIIKRLADEISVAAIAMLTRLDLTNLDVDVVLGGSVMHGRGPLLMDTVTGRITGQFPQANIHRLSEAPVVGAAMLAYDGLGITVAGRPNIPATQTDF
jgi:N-acetylglucosamine kinase-like BadF-type ATPase